MTFKWINMLPNPQNSLFLFLYTLINQTTSNFFFVTKKICQCVYWVSTFKQIYIKKHI